MFTQIMPTFPPNDLSNYDIEILMEDEFLMENSYDLWQILLDKQIPVDTITMMVMKYLNIYFKLKDRNDELTRTFTAQNYLLAGRMALSEKIMLC